MKKWTFFDFIDAMHERGLTDLSLTISGKYHDPKVQALYEEMGEPS